MKTTMIIAALLAVCISARADYNPDWWKNLVFEPIPTNDLDCAAAQLRQQDRSVWLLDGPVFAAADAVAATNIWNMLSILHGDLRSKKIENLPSVFRNFGMITNQVELQRGVAANELAKKVRNYESIRSGLEERIERVLANAAASDAIAAFPPSERNAIVSNLVETARFTPDEASALGLTNVVEAVSGK